MQTSGLLELKIFEGKRILQEVDAMRKGRGPVMNIVYYDSQDVEQCRSHIIKWQFTAKDILINEYGESHRYVSSFCGTMSNKNQGLDFKKEFRFEVSQGLTILESILESLKLELGNDKKIVSEEIVKTPMVFISHSSKDVEFVKALVTLLEEIGFNKSNLFCSSVCGYGIELSKDIFDALYSLFNEHNLYVIFVHSPRYYESSVSLNEMGAAWVLKTDFCSFLTTDMDFYGMKGVVDDRTISIKVDSEDALFRLTELKDKLIPLFGLSSVDNKIWDRKCKFFLDKVRYIHYENKPEEETELLGGTDKLILIIEKNPRISMRELSESTGLSSRTLAKHLKFLQDEGRLLRIGDSKDGCWEIVQKKEL